MCIEKKIKKNTNRRVAKTLNKKYRLYQSDIWGRLAVKKKYNFITSLIYQVALRKFNNIHRRKKLMQRGVRRRRSINLKKSKVTKGRLKYKKKRRVFDDRKHLIWKNLNAIEKRLIQRLYKKRGKVQEATSVTRYFVYRTTNQSPSRRKRGLTFRGLLLRNRRQISLFYGGGRIRTKTFRRYGRMLRADHKERTLIEGCNPGYNSFTSIIESRIDVLLFRANFVDTIYQARQFVFHRKVRVKGHKVVTNPGFLVKIWEPFLLRNDYWRNMRMKLMKNVMEKRIICFPSYLYINFAVMMAFKMKEPKAREIRYPFSELSVANLAMFRHSFRVL